MSEVASELIYFQLLIFLLSPILHGWSIVMFHIILTSETVRGKVGPILDIIPACRTRRFCGQLSTTSRDCDHNGHSQY
jgi:hypothetical protein